MHYHFTPEGVRPKPSGHASRAYTSTKSGRYAESCWNTYYSLEKRTKRSRENGRRTGSYGGNINNLNWQSVHLGRCNNLGRDSFQLAFDGFDIDACLALPYLLYIWYIRMLCSLKDSVNLLKCLTFSLNPVDSLQLSVKVSSSDAGLLTISTMIMISQPPLTIYIFHPMLVRPIGITNTKSNLPLSASNTGPGSLTYANPFSEKDAKAIPLARIE